MAAALGVVLVGMGVSPSQARVDGVEQVDVSSGEVPGDGFTRRDPDISSDGRFVVFTSDAANLVPGDTNGVEDVFLRDRAAGTTRLVSTAGSPADARSYAASVSDTGRYVLFLSRATNLAGGPAGPDAFLRDMSTGTVTRIASGVPDATLSAVGRYAAYVLSGRTYRWDRTTGTSTLVSRGRVPDISASGRYVVTAVTGSGGVPSYLFTDTTSGTTRDLLARAKASPAWSASEWGTVDDPTLSSNGRYVGFVTAAAGGLDAADDEADADIYLVDTADGDRYLRTTAGVLEDVVYDLAALSGNGRHLAAGVFDQTVTEYDGLVTFDRVSGLVSEVADFGGLGTAWDATGSRVVWADDYSRIGVFTGTPPTCTIDGTAGDDVLTGTPGDDVICGRGGDDVIEGLDGEDVLAGGPGTDTISFASADSGVRVRLYSWIATGQDRDEVYGFENVDGSAFDDRIWGDHEENRIRGGGGSDYCHGGDGVDTATGCEEIHRIP